jgi:hypothetical protein
MMAPLNQHATLPVAQHCRYRWDEQQLMANLLSKRAVVG